MAERLTNLEAVESLSASRAGPARRVLVAVDGLSNADAPAVAARLEGQLRARLPSLEVVAMVTTWDGRRVIVTPWTAECGGPMPLAPPLTVGGIDGASSAWREVLREAVRGRYDVSALVSGAPRDEDAEWFATLVSPVLEGGFDYVCPAYLRCRTDAAINTGIVYPLTRALYGGALRQPLGGEGAVSLSLAERLLAESDWRSDPASAGSDAWLVGKVLTSGARVCQAWLGRWPRTEPGPESVSHTLARVLGLVFREMERHAARWQRRTAPGPVPSFGVSGLLDEGPEPPVARFAAAFELGQRELAPVWSLVLPPLTALGLRRAAAAGEALRIPDEIWVRVVYDVAVAHFARLVERRQLLLAMTPNYLGWVASFTNEVRGLDADATEARIEALCRAFEREKPYLIARWRWPDSFNP